MFSKTFIVLLFTIIFATICQQMDAYRLDVDQTRTDILENNELKDPYFIQRLQALLAAAADGGNIEHEKRDSSALNHNLEIRLAMNRRPGLLRLKKND